MRLCLLLLVSPLVFCAKELPGEELPSKDIPRLDEEQPYPGEEEGSQMVKRSISEIAARRRSALDKTFMRFGRSDPDMPTEARVKMSGGNLMRFGRSKQSGFMRLGRAKNSDFMRFGRSPGNLMRFGRSSGNLMRFGRGNNNLMRFGRANNNLMRFGRGGNNLMRFGRANSNLMRFGRANNNLMRFGRANNNLMRFGRANNNLMRFGRSDEDFANYETDPNFEEFTEEEQIPTIASDSYVREERSAKDPPEPKAVNFKNDNFMRLGRSLLQKNYVDEDDDSQDSAEINDKEANEKLKMFIDENYMRMGGNNMDNQDGDAFDVLFPEESRKKRSLVKKAEQGVGTNADMDNKADVKGVRLVHSEGTSKCNNS